MKIIVENEGRRYWHQYVSHPDDIALLDVGNPFACMIWDCDSNFSVEQIDYIVGEILRKGCRSVVCGGSNCELWHDMTDEKNIRSNIDKNGDLHENYPLVMTTWHKDESPKDVALYFVNCATFDDLSFVDYVLLTIDCAKCPEVEEALNKCALYLDDDLLE